MRDIINTTDPNIYTTCLQVRNFLTHVLNISKFRRIVITPVLKIMRQ